VHLSSDMSASQEVKSGAQKLRNLLEISSYKRKHLVPWSLNSEPPRNYSIEARQEPHSDRDLQHAWRC
jgi:hypothetical protein